MFNRIIAVCLLFALAGSNFSGFWVIAGFRVNQKYIAQTLCENRDKPQLHCDGKCYLAKKIKQAEEKEKKKDKEEQRNRFQEALPSGAFSITFKKPVFKKIYPRVSAQQTVSRSFTIFQPPRIA